MSYRYDEDLEFLGKCSDEELAELYNVLTVDPEDGEPRHTETLECSEEHGLYGKQYSKFWRRIAEELQLYGGNTIANIFRGSTGVLYKEIATDVADKLKVKIDKEANIDEIENEIIEKFFEDIYGKLSQEDKELMFSELYSKAIKEDNTFKSFDKTLGAAYLVKMILKRGGIASYKIVIYLVDYVWQIIFRKTLSIAGVNILSRGLAMAIPGLNLLLNVWLISDITSAATRVTIPAVLLIATMRKKKQAEGK